MSEDIGADLFVMATDVDGVYLDWGTPAQRRLGEVTPEDLIGSEFPAGSMGPKVDAAVRFVAKTGRRAAIGSLADIPGIVAGTAGTNIVPRYPSGRPELAVKRWVVVVRRRLSRIRGPDARVAGTAACARARPTRAVVAAGDRNRTASARLAAFGR